MLLYLEIIFCDQHKNEIPLSFIDILLFLNLSNFNLNEAHIPEFCTF